MQVALDLTPSRIGRVDDARAGRANLGQLSLNDLAFAKCLLGSAADGDVEHRPIEPLAPIAVVLGGAAFQHPAQRAVTAHDAVFQVERSAGDAARRRLERNLHDGAQQRLVSLALTLRLAKLQLQRNPAETEQLLVEAADELRDAIDELRELARGIQPAVLTDRGLGPALEVLADHARLPVQLATYIPGRLPPMVEAVVYYVAAEGLTNIAKYADATAATVRLETRDNNVVLRVGDNGAGGADPRRGTGLRGLTDRVEALGGKLELQSPPGEGTVLTASIPYG